MPAHLAFQLYSARKDPLEETLPVIARLGYAEVEGYGALYADPADLRRQLDAFGMTMPTAHVGLAELENPEASLKLAETLGVQLLVCPIIPAARRPTDADGWRRFGEALEAIARPYIARGLGFAYHNHDFEFARLGDRSAFDLMLETAPSVALEADIAWIARAGADAPAWLGQNGRRVVAVHLKDLAPPGENADEGGWADFGHGVLPWPALLAAIKTQTQARWFVAEHDAPASVERFAARAMQSFNALTN